MFATMGTGLLILEMIRFNKTPMDLAGYGSQLRMGGRHES